MALKLSDADLARLRLEAARLAGLRLDLAFWHETSQDAAEKALAWCLRDREPGQ